MSVAADGCFAYVASQVLLAVISGAGSKSITFSVPEKVVTELHVGDPISVDKNGTDYQGTINEVSSMIDDSTGLFKVKASVENGDALPTGSTTKLSVISDRADNVLTIPVDAVYYSGGDAYVYTYDNGTVHYVPVEVGLYDSKKAQILSGINASDEVITTWSSELYEGSQVQKADPKCGSRYPGSRCISRDLCRCAERRRCRKAQRLPAKRQAATSVRAEGGKHQWD